jgi:hypothetical protein
MKHIHIYSNRWVCITLQPYLLRQVLIWLGGLASLADGLVRLSTFGMVMLSLQLRLAAFMCQQDLNRLKTK